MYRTGVPFCNTARSASRTANILSAINSLPATKQMMWVSYATRRKRANVGLSCAVNPSIEILRDVSVGSAGRFIASEGNPRNEYEEKMQFATSTSSPQSLFSVSRERDSIRWSSSLSRKRKQDFREFGQIGRYFYHPFENDLQSSLVEQTFSI